MTAAPVAATPVATASYFNALFFHPEILKADEDLARRFASADATFDDIFASAEAAGDKLLLALCATPLKRREEGLRSWREKQVARSLADSSTNHSSARAADLLKYGKSMESSQWDKIKAGECALIEIEQGAVKFFDDIARESSRLYADSKKALNLALQKAVHDPGENPTPFELPQSLYVSEDGEVLLFRKAKNAKQYGIAQAKFHVVVHIAVGTARFRRGSVT